jgi:hypothetical protein
MMMMMKISHSKEKKKLKLQRRTCLFGFGRLLDENCFDEEQSAETKVCVNWAFLAQLGPLILTNQSVSQPILLK